MKATLKIASEAIQFIQLPAGQAFIIAQGDFAQSFNAGLFGIKIGATDYYSL